MRMRTTKARHPTRPEKKPTVQHNNRPVLVRIAEHLRGDRLFLTLAVQPESLLLILRLSFWNMSKATKTAKLT